MTVEKIVRTIKIITARLVFQQYPQLKKDLWGGNFWTSGYYANTVGQYGNMDVKIRLENIRWALFCIHKKVYQGRKRNWDFIDFLWNCFEGVFKGTSYNAIYDKFSESKDYNNLSSIVNLLNINKLP